MEKRSTQVRSTLGKSLKKQAANVLTSFTPKAKSLKRQASNVLTSFVPKAKRSKGVSFQRRPSRPAKISRARVRYTIRGPRGKKRRFNYKPARKLDIWEY